MGLFVLIALLVMVGAMYSYIMPRYQIARYHRIVTVDIVCSVLTLAIRFPEI